MKPGMSSVDTLFRTLFRRSIAESSNGTTYKGFCLGPGGCKTCSTADFRISQLFQMLAYHWPQDIIAINRYPSLFNIDLHRDNTVQFLQPTDDTVRTTTTLDIFHINFKRHNQSPSNYLVSNPLLKPRPVGAGEHCKCNQYSYTQAYLSTLLAVTTNHLLKCRLIPVARAH